MRNLWKNKSLFLVYLFSNLLLLVIPAVTLVASTFASAKLQEHALEESSNQIAAQFDQALDNIFEKMDEMYRVLFRDDSVNKLLYRKRDLNNYDSYTIVQIVEFMASLPTQNDLIKEVYLYFPASGKIVTPSYCLDAQTYYSRIENYKDMTFEQWSGLLREGFPKTTYLNLPSNDWKGQELQTFSFARTLYITNDLQYNPVLVCMMSRPDIYSLMEDLLGASSLTGMIVTDEDDGMEIHPLLQYPLDGRRTEHPIHLESGVKGWDYQIYMDRNSLWSDVITTIQAILIFVSIGFLLNVAAAFLLAYNNYVPIRKLMRRAVREEPSKVLRRNELAQIESVLSNSFREQEQMEKRLKKMEPVYVNHFLASVLKGHIQADDIALDTLERYGIHFEGSRFLVVNILFADVPRDDSRESSSQLEWEPELMRMIVQNVMDELFGLTASIAYIFHEQRTVAALVNLLWDISQEEVMEKLKAMRSFLLEKMHLQATLFVSDVVNGFQNVPEAYYQAQQVAQSTFFLTAGDIICYQDIMHDSMGYCAYTVEDEIVLMNCVRAGEREKAANMLRMLFDLHQGSEAGNNVQIPYFMIHLLSTYLKTAQQLDVTVQANLELLTMRQSPQQIRERFFTLFDELTLTAQQKGDRSHRLIQQIAQLTESLYADSQLSISMLADRVGLNASYLSAQYKKLTGEHLSDYINQVRISHAKELLANPELNMMQVAQSVGYRSDVNLIRVFKKFEGVTPGAYRKNLS